MTTRKMHLLLAGLWIFGLLLNVNVDRLARDFKQENSTTPLVVFCVAKPSRDGSCGKARFGMGNVAKNFFGQRFGRRNFAIVAQEKRLAPVTKRDPQLACIYLLIGVYPPIEQRPVGVAVGDSSIPVCSNATASSRTLIAYCSENLLRQVWNG